MIPLLSISPEKGGNRDGGTFPSEKGEHAKRNSIGPAEWMVSWTLYFDPFGGPKHGLQRRGRKSAEVQPCTSPALRPGSGAPRSPR
jgi:hypothetical protein